MSDLLRAVLPDSLDVFAWNPHKGNDWATIEKTLDRQLQSGRLDVIALNEVRRHWHALRQWAKKNGYDIYQERPRPDGDPMPSHGSTALLVTNRRADLAIERHRVVKMAVRWKVFSHNQIHKPRRYERVRIETGGGYWKVTASHWPTNGFKGGNRVAFAESATRAAKSFAARRNTVVVDVGDHNEDVKTLRKWATPFGAVVDGHGPDSLIATRATVRADVGQKNGSDHHWIRYRVTRK